MIIFSKLTFANFLSVGNQAVSVDLNGSKTTLIHGTNGSGKSTILDALTYSLFGKSFRGVNLSQLINTQNKKGMMVECEFNIGKNEYLVRRGMKPKVFEVYRNSELIDAKAADKDNQAYLENHILKLSYKSFTQIVILGSSNFVPFMQLNSAGRRECVEDFLDIGVFSTMSIMAKERLRGLKDQLNTFKGDISTLEYKIDIQRDRISELEGNNEELVAGLRREIKECEEEKEECEELLEMELSKEEKLFGVIKSRKTDDPVGKSNQLNTILIKFNNKIERLRKDHKFFDNEQCPTCHQEIEYALKTSHQGAIQKEIDTIQDAIEKATEEMRRVNLVIDEIEKRQNEISDIQQTTFRLNTQIKSHQQTIASRLAQIGKIEMDTSSVDKEQGKLELLLEEMKEMKDKAMEMMQEMENHQIVADLLKDSGIKAQVVKKYLPAMNKYIRHYLGELDFPIHFQLDEQFNESVHSPLHQDFCYQSFSEGQKGRIDLALMLTWREVGRLKNSVSTNLLILDEVFSSSLDDTGKECLLTLLRYRLPESQKILVVDHTLSDSFKEKFDTSVEVTRTGGFSRYS